MYLCYSALQSEPREYQCNGLAKRLTAASSTTLATGMLVTLISVIYSAFRAGELAHDLRTEHLQGCPSAWQPPATPLGCVSAAWFAMCFVVAMNQRHCGLPAMIVVWCALMLASLLLGASCG
jgi:hypothetical protein